MADTLPASPRPWFPKHSQNHLAVYWGNPRGSKVAEMAIHPSSPYREEGLANAALIVKAVNLHDNLIEALRGVLEICGGDWDFESGADPEKHPAVAYARLVLAKAEMP